MTVEQAVKRHTDILLRWIRQGSPESDTELNRSCRDVIKAMKEEIGSAWLLDINEDTWVEWDGVEAPRNFCATHVLPARFEAVAKAVTARQEAPYTGTKDDAKRVEGIQGIIDDLGGQVLVWS